MRQQPIIENVAKMSPAEKVKKGKAQLSLVAEKFKLSANKEDIPVLEEYFGENFTQSDYRHMNHETVRQLNNGMVNKLAKYMVKEEIGKEVVELLAHPEHHLGVHYKDMMEEASIKFKPSYINPKSPFAKDVQRCKSIYKEGDKEFLIDCDFEEGQIGELNITKLPASVIFLDNVSYYILPNILAVSKSGTTIYTTQMVLKKDKPKDYSYPHILSAAFSSSQGHYNAPESAGRFTLEEMINESKGYQEQMKVTMRGGSTYEHVVLPWLTDGHTFTFEGYGGKWLTASVTVRETYNLNLELCTQNWVINVTAKPITKGLEPIPETPRMIWEGYYMHDARVIVSNMITPNTPVDMTISILNRARGKLKLQTPIYDEFIEEIITEYILTTRKKVKRLSDWLSTQMWIEEVKLVYEIGIIYIPVMIILFMIIMMLSPVKNIILNILITLIIYIIVLEQFRENLWHPRNFLRKYKHKININDYITKEYLAVVTGLIILVFMAKAAGLYDVQIINVFSGFLKPANNTSLQPEDAIVFGGFEED